VRRIIESGTVFGKLTVISEIESVLDPHGVAKRRFKCLCSCGSETVVRMNNLTSGKVKACGNSRNHSVSHLKLHSVWRGMRNRCYSQAHEKYHRYGGRGIVMCDLWKNDFMPFFKWANENGWEEGLDLDRKDNDGNYEPSNCRFVTRVVNANNKVRTVMVEYGGEKIAFSILLRKLNLHSKYNTYHARLKKGWTIDQILLTPVLNNVTRVAFLNTVNKSKRHVEHILK